MRSGDPHDEAPEPMKGKRYKVSPSKVGSQASTDSKADDESQTKDRAGRLDTKDRTAKAKPIGARGF